MTPDRGPRREPAHRPGSHARRLLVVDDEPGMRVVLARAMARHGYEVFTAGGGIQALDQLATLEDLDAVLSDVTMPGMTGVELAYEILARRPGLPILFITASALPHALLQHPLIALLAKPPPLGLLYDRVAHLIARSGPGDGARACPDVVGGAEAGP